MRPVKVTARPGEPPQPPPLRPVADHHEREPEARERLDRDVDPLVRHQLGEHDVVVADRARREAVDLHRRVQDGRLAPEVAAHALGGGARVGDVAVDALGGDPVPLAPLGEQQPQRRAHERVAGPQRRLALGPGVAERVVAVTDVDGAGIDEHAVRPRARRRDHGVVAAQVERLDRVGVERQQRAERARGRPQALQERGVDRAVREPTFGAVLVVDRGEDVGVRPRVADRREHPLGAAEVQQEVVDQGDAGRPSSARV